MPAPDLIQQQRELLRAFRQATAQRTKAEADAQARFKHEMEAIETAWSQARQQVDEQINQAREAFIKASDILKKGHWTDLIANAKPSDFNLTRNDPAQELRAWALQAQEEFERLSSLFVGIDGVVIQRHGLGYYIVAWFMLSVLIGAIPAIIALSVLLLGIQIDLYFPYEEWFVLAVFGTIATIVTIISFIVIRQVVRKSDLPRERFVFRLPHIVEQAEHCYKRWLEQLQAPYQRQLADTQTNYQQTLDSIAQAFQQQMSQLHLAFAKLTSQVGVLSPIWGEQSWSHWAPAVSFPSMIRLGELQIGVHQDHFLMPALLHLPGQRSLLLKAAGPAKPAAVQSIQSLLLRLLATIPPGKLRFTFIDPVGLGQNVAPFMHLADYDEALVAGKAWTEPQHIEGRLADLTEHMENVIQKYLRNQFATIEEYNAQAGEVAEPYRALVVLDFPANFSEAAARRLVSIAQNGPRCGVYAVVLADTEKPLPHGFNLADLEQASTVIAWDGQRFVWQDPDFQGCLLELDAPPDAGLFNRIVSTVGEAAKAASRVEVPFARIAPPPEQWWMGDARDGLRVPLGPSGARRVQILDLGQGTAQHALVAGKTGSGKSTLLHTLITSLALAYSPDQVELYLIDFKKGVEFKTYAAHGLPHARVVAIESEREFGLSVLQGLDAELKRRGDLFRAAGVDHIADYRAKNLTSLPPAPSPLSWSRKNQERGEGEAPSAAPGVRGEVLSRILLLVDEFQEFFTEDDAIAAQAAQILDRLVRQGRAFGIHVLLGSQTLAGAYSLARSTIDQMAVRIALQCSEADSRLILADDNPAARLLSRPGEAIYNAANGLIEGNNRFQVAWLPDDERDRYLAQAQALAQGRAYPQIVFEGNAPAHIEANHLLRDLLLSPLSCLTGEGPGVRALPAWLGEPVEIKPHTAAFFRRQSRSNLLIVGQNDYEGAAAAMLTAAVLSLAAQHRPEAARFVVLNLSDVDAPWHDLPSALRDALPHAISVIGRRRDVLLAIGEVAAEVNARLAQAEEARWPSLYLVVIGLHRARDLRRDESYPSFSFSGEEGEARKPRPWEQLATICREGPDLGVHTLLWCDTCANLERVLDRREIAEFDMRVALQMGASDSRELLDSEAATKLGPYRALFFDEERTGRLEKFRPYGLPAVEWLAWAGKQLRGRLGS